MTIKRVYKNTMIGSQMILANGKAIQFPQGRFETSEPKEIEELDANIAAGVPHLYVDPQDMTVDTEEVDFVRKAQAEATVRALKEFQQRKEREQGTVVNSSDAIHPPTGTPLKPGASDVQQEAQVETVSSALARDDDKKAAEGSQATAQDKADADKQAEVVQPNANLAQLLSRQKSGVGVAGTGHGAV